MNIESENKLKKWLEDSGHNLEMKVADLFLKKGFMVRASEYYLDLKENKFREIDIVATREKSYKGMRVILKIIIECKKSKYPWVLYTSENENWMFEQNPQISNYLRSGSKMGKVFNIVYPNLINKNLEVFDIPKRIGHSLIEGFKKVNKEDSSHKSIYQLLKALNHFENQSMEENTDIIIYLPVVILDGNLYETYIGKEAKQELNEIDSGVLLSHNKSLENSIGLITIQNFKNLDLFIRKLDQTVTELFLKNDESFKKLIDKFLNSEISDKEIN